MLFSVFSSLRHKPETLFFVTVHSLIKPGVNYPRTPVNQYESNKLPLALLGYFPQKTFSQHLLNIYCDTFNQNQMRCTSALTLPVYFLNIQYIFSVLPGGVETWLGNTWLQRFNIKCHKCVGLSACLWMEIYLSYIFFSHVLRRQSKHFLGHVSKMWTRVRGLRCVFFNPTKSGLKSEFWENNCTYFLRKSQFI